MKDAGEKLRERATRYVAENRSTYDIAEWLEGYIRDELEAVTD